MNVKDVLTFSVIKTIIVPAKGTLVVIVVSLPCTSYQCGSLIVLCDGVAGTRRGVFLQGIAQFHQHLPAFHHLAFCHKYFFYYRVRRYHDAVFHFHGLQY